MNTKTFIKALLPVWLAELVLGGLHYVYGSDVTSTSGTVFLVISIMLLPFIAGFLVVNSGGGIGLAMAGAASISLVSLLTVGVSYVITAAGLMAFGGLVIGTLMFSVMPQVICGAIGGLTARMINTKSTV